MNPNAPKFSEQNLLGYTAFPRIRDSQNEKQRLACLDSSHLVTVFYQHRPQGQTRQSPGTCVEHTDNSNRE